MRPRSASRFASAWGVLALALAACATAPGPTVATTSAAPSARPNAPPSAVPPSAPSSAVPASPTSTGPVALPTSSTGPPAEPPASLAPAALAVTTALGEVRVSPSPGGLLPPYDRGFEPVVATHPTDPRRIAVAYARYGAGASLPALRISHDGGETWRDASALPWAGSGRSPGNHAAIAWGPGPRPGSARLYWTDATIGADGLFVSVAWTDDEGASWSTLHVERRTPPWIGAFPDITVDRDPRSPNYGAVYVAYNWLADPVRGPGLRVLASSDYGRSWSAADVAAAAAPAGYPAAWRIDYRVRTAPDGGLYVAFFQANLRVWDSSRIFWKGSLANVGRVGFAVARLQLDRSRGTLAARPARMVATLARDAYTALDADTPGTTDNLTDPDWSLGIDVDPGTGRVLLAIADYQPGSRPRGSVRVGRSDDQGLTWKWVVLPPLPDVDGFAQSSYRPNIAAVGGRVFVGMRGITDVALGGGAGPQAPTIGEAYAISLDGGRTFGAPRMISRARWAAAALEPSTNGPGLRERADRTADGRFVYVYADGRLAAPPPDPHVGRAAIFIAVLNVPR